MNQKYKSNKNTMETQYIITQSQLQSIADYLVEQPFKQVAGLINIVSSLPVINEENAEPETKPEADTEPEPEKK